MDEKISNGIIADFFISISEIIPAILLTIFIDNIYIVAILIWINLFDNITFVHNINIAIEKLEEKELYIKGNSILYFIRSLLYVYQFLLIYTFNNELYLSFLIFMTASKMISEYGYNIINNHFKSKLKN